MSRSISNVRKQIGRPPVGATPITMRVPPDLLARLDGWIDKQPDPKPGRTEAIRQILDAHLKD